MCTHEDEGKKGSEILYLVNLKYIRLLYKFFKKKTAPTISGRGLRFLEQQSCCSKFVSGDAYASITGNNHAMTADVGHADRTDHAGRAGRTDRGDRHGHTADGAGIGDGDAVRTAFCRILPCGKRKSLLNHF